MYALIFDMDNDILSKSYGKSSYKNAYNDIKTTLADFGFYKRQGSVYYSDETVDAFKAIRGYTEIIKKHDWFIESVTDVRLLKIEDEIDFKVKK